MVESRVHGARVVVVRVVRVVGRKLARVRLRSGRRPVGVAMSQQRVIDRRVRCGVRRQVRFRRGLERSRSRQQPIGRTVIGRGRVCRGGGLDGLS